jgi:hypothetical protein
VSSERASSSPVTLRSSALRRASVWTNIIVLGEEHLRRILKNYAAYYNTVRTHRSLHKDAPMYRPIRDPAP